MLSVGAVEASKADGPQNACIAEIETDEGIIGSRRLIPSTLVVKIITEVLVSYDNDDRELPGTAQDMLGFEFDLMIDAGMV